MGALHSCSLCDFQTNHISNLRLHKSTIHEGTKFPCNLCNYEATQKQSLKNHKRSQHGIDKLNCEICEFKALSLKILDRHMQDKHNVKREIQKRNQMKAKSNEQQDDYICNICDKSLRSHKNFQNHMDRVHAAYTHQHQ